MDQSKDIIVVNTTEEDLSEVVELFNQAIASKDKPGYMVWDRVDKEKLKKEIESRLQFKILNKDEIMCIFSIQYSDPIIWRERDQGHAIYLYRIVANQKFKVQKKINLVLSWAKDMARQKHLKFIRLDTWADNQKLIDYYRSFGFEFVENYKTPNSPELPLPNRNLNVALLEICL